MMYPEIAAVASKLNAVLISFLPDDILDFDAYK